MVEIEIGLGEESPITSFHHVDEEYIAGK